MDDTIGSVTTGSGTTGSGTTGSRTTGSGITGSGITETFVVFFALLLYTKKSAPSKMTNNNKVIFKLYKISELKINKLRI
jgi:hypothetical protein